jgi:signal transduction histidine kinase
MPSFISDNIDEIVTEWESFARTVSPAAATMNNAALRDHVRQMLDAIVLDIETFQSGEEQEQKSKGSAPRAGRSGTPAEVHGRLRHGSGFDLEELVAEFRALRASVLRIWMRSAHYRDPDTAYQITRFNEAIDQALAESVATYSAELTRSRDTFLAILGHDLRSPLGAVANALHLLSAPGTEAQRAETLATGRRSVALMGSMIRDLLEYTRTRLGSGIPIAPASGDLTSVCKAAFNEVSLVHPQTAFRFEAEPGVTGTFDAARMHQVVSNLLNNAVQHGERGSPVVIVVSRNADALVVRVKNRGPVIAPEMLQVIFDPLVQIPRMEPSVQHFSNLGLGLFIAREIVEAHGGTITASSSPEETQFTVEIPQPVHAGTRAAHPGEHASAAR